MQIIHYNRKIADFINDGDGNESGQKAINLHPVQTPGSDIFFSGLTYGSHVLSTPTNGHHLHNGHFLLSRGVGVGGGEALLKERLNCI